MFVSHLGGGEPAAMLGAVLPRRGRLVVFPARVPARGTAGDGSVREALPARRAAAQVVSLKSKPEHQLCSRALSFGLINLIII